MWVWLHKFASPPHFYRLAGQLVPWFGWSAFVLIVTALYGGLVLAPPDSSAGTHGGLVAGRRYARRTVWERRIDSSASPE